MTDERSSLEGRVAIVTGGGTGIGRAVAVVFARHGADVVLAARRPEPIRSTAKEVEALGRRALAVPTDVTDAHQCEALVAATLAEFGRVDVLVNNAGGSETRPPLDWSVEQWHNAIDLNLSSVWYLSRAAAKPMLEQGKGSIVNISSGAGIRPVANLAPYGAAKAAVNNLTGALAAAWTPSGIRVNAVAAGAIRTELMLEDLRRLGLDESVLASGNLMARLGDPEEIGYAVLFFASDASSFCTGQTLWVNGGPK
jgi:NAD(P)-dependent dehydrogenase (short-subunit alcohol dehydrogenase family)